MNNNMWKMALRHCKHSNSLSLGNFCVTLITQFHITAKFAAIVHMQPYV